MHTSSSRLQLHSPSFSSGLHNQAARRNASIVAKQLGLVQAARDCCGSCHLQLKRKRMFAAIKSYLCRLGPRRDINLSSLGSSNQPRWSEHPHRSVRLSQRASMTFPGQAGTEREGGLASRYYWDIFTNKMRSGGCKKVISMILLQPAKNMRLAHCMQETFLWHYIFFLQNAGRVLWFCYLLIIS